MELIKKCSLQNDGFVSINDIPLLKRTIDRHKGMTRQRQGYRETHLRPYILLIHHYERQTWTDLCQFINQQRSRWLLSWNDKATVNLSAPVHDDITKTSNRTASGSDAV